MGNTSTITLRSTKRTRTVLSGTMAFTLPPLPYAYDALEPQISAQIMTLHHTKHHQTYINVLNATLASQATASNKSDIVTQLHLQNNLNFRRAKALGSTYLPIRFRREISGEVQRCATWSQGLWM